MLLENESIFCEVKVAAFDFDGVFTDNFVYCDERGIESVRCSRLDGIGLSRVKSVGVYPVIISSEENEVVSMRAQKMRVDCFQGVKDKALVIRQIIDERSISSEEVMFLGNDVNDLPALSLVGIPVGVADSMEEILPNVRYKCLRGGGKGAVREVCDLIWEAKRAF